MTFRSAIIAVAITFNAVLLGSAQDTSHKPSAIKSHAEKSPHLEKIKPEKSASQSESSAKDEAASHREDFQAVKEELKAANSKDRLKEQARKVRDDVKEVTRKGGKPRE
jgi:hypothetical protein